MAINPLSPKGHVNLDVDIQDSCNCCVWKKRKVTPQEEKKVTRPKIKNPLGQSKLTIAQRIRNIFSRK